MKTIAIVGTGPTGVYAFKALATSPRAAPLAVWLFEKGADAGVGMPYSDDTASHVMLANIASIEIPPVTRSYLDWLRAQTSALLRSHGIDPEHLNERDFTPRLMLGRYYRDEFDALVHAAEALGHRVELRERTEVTDLVTGLDGGIRLTTEHGDVGAVFDKVILATGHSFPQDAETRRYFPSPWSGLVDAVVPACRVGVLGTSLSAIDAAMAVATQHGRFVGISWTGADAAGGIGDQWFALSMRTRVIYAANDLDFFSFTCEQLADPEWKGRVCIRSGQHPYNTALFSALVSHQDAAATEGWLTGLKFNLARKTGGGDRDGAKDILGGICDIAVASSYVG